MSEVPVQRGGRVARDRQLALLSSEYGTYKTVKYGTYKTVKYGTYKTVIGRTCAQVLRVRDAEGAEWREIGNWPSEETGNFHKFTADGSGIYADSSMAHGNVPQPRNPKRQNPKPETRNL